MTKYDWLKAVRRGDVVVTDEQLRMLRAMAVRAARRGLNRMYTAGADERWAQALDLAEGEVFGRTSPADMAALVREMQTMTWAGAMSLPVSVNILHSFRYAVDPDQVKAAVLGMYFSCVPQREQDEWFKSFLAGTFDVETVWGDFIGNAKAPRIVGGDPLQFSSDGSAYLCCECQSLSGQTASVRDVVMMSGGRGTFTAGLYAYGDVVFDIRWGRPGQWEAHVA